MKKLTLFLCALLLLAALAGCGGQTSTDPGSPADQAGSPPSDAIPVDEVAPDADPSDALADGQSLNYDADAVPKTPVDAATPMVFVEGALYVSTGQVSDVEGRCGNMDGAITATVPATETPTQEGESNFGTGYAYQIGPDGTIEIPMRLDSAADPQWIVFQKESCK